MIMTTMKSSVCRVVLGGIVFAGAVSAYAQISSINSAWVSPRAFNDVPGATYTGVTNYPTTVSFSEQNVSKATGFANRDLWRFSNNNGASAYQLAANDYFHASFDLTLTGNPISPRKEAGFLFSTGSNGDIQFVVNTDGHEVVQFGGISFFSFNATDGLTYNSGTKITLGMSYFLDGNGKNAMQFFANSFSSPVFEFGPTVGSGANDIGTGSVLGGYFQIQNDASNPLNSGSAVFGNLNITPVVPEPSGIALFGLGAAALILRRRK